MARNTTWGELKIGLIAFIALVTGVVSVLLFARVGALRGDTTNIYVLTDEAAGVLSGTEVWLSGHKVGLVKDIHFRSVTTDTLQRLAIHTEILSKRLHLVRKDAYADIRAGANLIGSPVVFISSGTTGAEPLRDGDTLFTKSVGPMKPLGLRVDTIIARLGELADSGARAVALLNSPAGTVGAFNRGGIPQLANASAVLSGMTAKATTGSGTVGLALRGDIGQRVSRIIGAKDSLMLMLSTGDGNVGRFRRDSTLFKTVAGIKADVDSLMAMTGRQGTISRAQSDTTLKGELAKARAALTELMADIKKNPGRYISF